MLLSKKKNQLDPGFLTVNSKKGNHLTIKLNKPKCMSKHTVKSATLSLKKNPTIEFDIPRAQNADVLFKKIVRLAAVQGGGLFGFHHTRGQVAILSVHRGRPCSCALNRQQRIAFRDWHLAFPRE